MIYNVRYAELYKNVINETNLANKNALYNILGLGASDTLNP